jgi:hypothetical protein
MFTHVLHQQKDFSTNNFKILELLFAKPPFYSWLYNKRASKGKKFIQLDGDEIYKSFAQLNPAIICWPIAFGKCALILSLLSHHFT